MAESSGGHQKPFRFLDLPTELRCRVYSYLLESDIEVYMIRKPTRFPPSFRLTIACTRNREGRLPNISPNVTCANKLVHKEATPILYNGNKFSTPRPEFMTQFIEQIGDNVQYVRHVDLHDARVKKHAKALFVALKAAKRLTSLSLPFPITWSAYPKPSELATAIGPLFRAMHKSERKDTDIKDRNVLDGLVIKKFRDPDETRDAKTEEYERQVKEIIAATLK